MAVSNVRVAKNIMKKYGVDRFRTLINSFQRNVSGPKIAEEFGVTRQRVNQWKNAFGEEEVKYNLDPEIVNLLNSSPDA